MELAAPGGLDGFPGLQDDENQQRQGGHVFRPPPACDEIQRHSRQRGRSHVGAGDRLGNVSTQAALPMTRLTLRLRHARTGMTKTAAAATAAPRTDPSGRMPATSPPTPTRTM